MQGKSTSFSLVKQLRKKDARKEVALILTSGLIPRGAKCLQSTSVSVRVDRDALNVPQSLLLTPAWGFFHPLKHAWPTFIS